MTDREKAIISAKWIPATIKPSYSGLYLISIDDLVTARSFDGSFFRTHDGTKIDVDAWMPLPEPYKDPLDHSDEPVRCKAEGCSAEGCKHCENYEPVELGGDS